MAGATVTVGERGRRGFFVLGPGIGGGTVLVFVVPEMFRRVATAAQQNWIGSTTSKRMKRTRRTALSVAAPPVKTGGLMPTSRAQADRAGNALTAARACAAGVSAVAGGGEALNTISPFDIIPT